MKDHYVRPGAHHLGCATAPRSCHGVFIDSFFLERISNEWDFHGNAMANDKKLIWRHCVTESDWAFASQKKGYSKNRSVYKSAMVWLCIACTASIIGTLIEIFLQRARHARENLISDGWMTWERISQKLIVWRYVLRGS